MKNYPRKYKCVKHPIMAELKAIRLAKKLRGDILSDMLGYHHATISRWERGYKFPSWAALLSWCEALGVQLTVAKQ